MRKDWMSHIPHAVTSWFVMVVGDLEISPGSGFTTIKEVPCVTPSWLWHDLFICVTWLIHTCDMCRSSVYDNCDMTHCSTVTLKAASRLSSESHHSLCNIYPRFIWGTWHLFLSLLLVKQTEQMKIIEMIRNLKKLLIPSPNPPDFQLAIILI